MLLFVFLALCLATLVVAQNVTYDYVIAGAGTAGLLLAVVLSENPDITVAVLEGGGDARTNPNVTIPELRGMIAGTQYDWYFASLPQPGLYESRVQNVNRGKTLGGTSSMNWLIVECPTTLIDDVVNPF